MADTAAGTTVVTAVDFRQLESNETTDAEQFTKADAAGVEKVFVSLSIQTDLSWTPAIEQSLSRARANSIVQSRRASVSKVSRVEAPIIEAESTFQSEPEADDSPRKKSSFSTGSADMSGMLSAPQKVVQFDIPAYPLPKMDDEYGVPLDLPDLEMETDSEVSDSERAKRSQPTSSRRARRDSKILSAVDQLVPSLGPPAALAYVREGNREPISQEEMARLMQKQEELAKQFEQSLNFQSLFTGKCEYCGNDRKPFPTREQQEMQPPEELYCCEQFKEYFDVLIEQLAKPATVSTSFDISPHAKYSKSQRKNSVTQNQQRQQFQQQMRTQQRAFMQSRTSERTRATEAQESSDFISIQDSSIIDPADLFDQAEVEWLSMPTAPKATVRQMRTINFQLSSKRCAEAGWILAPLEKPKLLEVSSPAFQIESLDASGVFQSLLAGDSIPDCVQQYYPDGTLFLTLFKDGNGNVYYPNGELAIILLRSTLDSMTYIILPERKEQPYPTSNPVCSAIAVFDTRGFGYCNYENGSLHVSYDQFSAKELADSGEGFAGTTRSLKVRASYDDSGINLPNMLKRKWKWRDFVPGAHIPHAPPIQPLIFKLNETMSVHMMKQEQIIVTFAAKTRSCRFNAGSRLKLVKPELLPAPAIDTDRLLLSEIGLRVLQTIDKVNNLFRYPTSTKTDKIEPPKYIMQRLEKNAQWRHLLPSSGSAKSDPEPDAVMSSRTTSVIRSETTATNQTKRKGTTMSSRIDEIPRNGTDRSVTAMSSVTNHLQSY